MTDKDNRTDSATGAPGKKTLTLKGSPSLSARSGSSRSSRTVVVERRTRRVGAPGSAGPAPRGAGPAEPV
ncbi:MAG TPA: hypothetical protein VMW31_03735, partial [Devosiaceae bacterium]|nr:hypothetical protein [Devosiaceae bacterium]